MDTKIKAAEDMLHRHAKAYLDRTKTHGEQDARASADRNRFGGALEMAAILLGSREAVALSDRIERELGETPPRGPALFEVSGPPLPRVNLSARADIISADDYARRQFLPPSTSPHILVVVENAGPGIVIGGRVRALDGDLRPDQILEPIAAGGRREILSRVERTSQGTYVGLPSTIEVQYDAEGWTSGILTLTSTGFPPAWRTASAKSPVRVP